MHRLAGLAVLVLASPASAATLSPVLNMSGSAALTDVTAQPGVAPPVCTGPSCAWGVPAKPYGTDQSSYRMDIFEVSTDAGSFVVGEFRHNNGVLWEGSASLTSVDLAFDFAGTFAGQAFSFSRELTLTHDESLNASLDGSLGTDDVVLGFGDFAPFTLDVREGDVLSTLEITGFANDSCTTPEAQVCVLPLMGRITTETVTGQEPQTPAPVPLPAAGLLLAGALVLLGSIGRRP